MNRLRILFSLFLFTQFFYGQIDFKFHHNINSPVPQYIFDTDSTANNFQILQIPFLGFDVSAYSKPSLNNFLSNSHNNYIINLNDYRNSIKTVSHHVLDFENMMFYYTRKKDNVIQSYGFSHRLFGEFSLSNEFVSLIVDGNYQHLNNPIYLDNNYARVFNYFSIFYGYANAINNRSIFGFKCKLLKGFSSFGIDSDELSLVFYDHFGTEENPFSSSFNTDFNYFENSDYSMLSNLGFAIDLEFQYKVNDDVSLYTHISDLGCIFWKEDQYFSQGSFDFNGLDYSLNQDLITEFNGLYDTIVDIFDIKQNNNVTSLRLIPFEIDFGVNIHSNNVSQFIVNYNCQKLYDSFVHTASISYLQYIQSAKLALIPTYSLNKFNYINLALYVNKKWGNRVYTNFYLKNMLGVINNDSFDLTRGFGLGGELLLVF